MTNLFDLAQEKRVLRFNRVCTYDYNPIFEDNLVYVAARSVGLTMEEVSGVLPGR